MLNADSSLDGLMPAAPSASRKDRCAGVTVISDSLPGSGAGKVCALVPVADSEGGIPMVAMTSSPIPQPLTINAAHATAALAVRGPSSCTPPTYRLASTEPGNRLLKPRGGV